MITIVITGPSGSGKSVLTNKLYELFDDSIILKTDSYYRDNIFIKCISSFQFDIYDRPLSINLNAINKTLNSIYKKEKLISLYNYDFHKKKSTRSKIILDYKGEKQFLIVEGIFSHRLDLNYQNCLNIVVEEEKELCLKRRIKRDQLYRGRNILEINQRFDKSWYLFYKNMHIYEKKYKHTVLNSQEKILFNKLVSNLRKIKKN